MIRFWKWPRRAEPTGDPDQLSAQARARIVDLTSGVAGDAEWQAFEKWSSSSRAHEEAARDALATWQVLDCMPHLADLEKPRPVHAAYLANRFKEPSRARWLIVPLTAGAFALLFVFGGPVMKTHLEPGTVTTASAEIKQLRLADGSIVSLGGLSRVTVDFNRTSRDVHLLEGQGFFKIAKDPRRPFIVHARKGQITAVGTEFNVHEGPDGVTVSVQEGVVQVTGNQGGDGAKSWVALVRQGQEMVYNTTGLVVPVHDASVGHATAWQQQRLEYEEASLETIVTDLNRFTKLTFVIADSDLNNLRLTAAFDVDHVDALLQAMERSLPVTITRVSSDTVVLRHRETTKASS